MSGVSTSEALQKLHGLHTDLMVLLSMFSLCDSGGIDPEPMLRFVRRWMERAHDDLWEVRPPLENAHKDRKEDA